LDAVGIDLGGTNIKVGLVNQAGAVREFVQAPADVGRGPDAVVEDVRKLVEKILAETNTDLTELIGVGVGSPGPLSPNQGRIYKGANLPGWEDVPLRDMMGDALRLPAVLDNDANVAALAEWWVGAGRDGADFVMLTLGTGVGCGVVLGEQVFHGHHENAAELGHMIVVPNGLPCPCGQRGCLERYAAASAVANRVKAAIEAGEASRLADALHVSGRLDTRQIVEAAQDGDPLCGRIWEETCLYLAIACINIQHVYNPSQVALGGGMAEAGDFLFDRVRTLHTQLTWHLVDDRPQIVPAELGYRAGVVGAAALAWRASGASLRSPDEGQPT
jgi:glucokinase